MSANKILFLGIAIMIVLLSTSCAKQVAPSGGDKDITLPSILSTYPSNKTTNSNPKIVELKFDEYVIIDNSKILISPYMKTLPVCKIKGKSIRLFFKEPLKENTTYSLQFNNAIKDLTENNTISNYTLTFSTGNKLDSLSIKGKVLSAYNNKAVPNALILLYKGNTPDSAVTTQAPTYISQANSDGNFIIPSISPDSYKLYSLVDKNNNYFFDQANEEIAFNDSIVLINNNQINQNYNLYLFSEGKNKPILIEKKIKSKGHIQLIYSKPIKQPTITPLDTSINKNNFIYETTQNNDTIHIWYKNISEKQQLDFALHVKADSIVDTIKLKEYNLNNEIDGILYESNLKGRGTMKFDYFNPIKFIFNHPIKNLMPEKWILRENGSKVENFKQYIHKDSLNTRKITINYTWKPETPYSLTIPDSTIIDFFDKKNEITDLVFNTKAKKEYGTINLQLLNYNPNTNYIIQLYQAQKIILEKTITQQKIELPNINPNKYTILIILDTNNNHKWDTGNLTTKQQPEKVITSKEFEVKENWDTELEINLK